MRTGVAGELAALRRSGTLSAMAAQMTWILYAGTFYVVWTAGFRLWYGRWPTAYRLPPRDLGHGVYMLADLLLNLSLCTYTAWLLLGPMPEALHTGAGVAIVAAGAALRLWTVLTLGRNWRMGQDESDSDASFVATGPYRFLQHPINAALVIVAAGQGVLTGFDARAWFLIVVALLYYLVQGRAERVFWGGRGAAAG